MKPAISILGKGTDSNIIIDKPVTVNKFLATFSKSKHFSDLLDMVVITSKTVKNIQKFQLMSYVR